MKIGELAEITGTTVETIRFYERENLLRSAARAGNNYRMYSQEHVDQLAFIRRCRSLDMTLDEVRALLLLRAATAEDCSDVNALLDKHIEHVMHRIHELNALVAELNSIRANCSSSRPLAECGILSELESGSATSNASTHPRRHIHGTH
jgi:Cd(II)/Pb(II)-responsive transcriptional regulator